MAGTPIGRILLMPKGNYSGTAVYNGLDWVRYNGSAWVCTTDNTTGIAPAIGVPEWQVLAQDGTVSGTVDWSNVNFKPFDTVGSGLDVDVSNALKLDMSMLTGSNISYDNSGSGAASNNVQSAIDELFRGGGGGGLLPYFFIDSEAGSTVTVSVPDGSTITPTAAGSGHWECSVPMYGTYTIHSVLAGQGDATVSVNVDDVKQYHITDNHYDFTINVTAPNSSSIRITGGTETYTGTGTGSSQAFAVHTPSTVYTVAVTMDGNTKSDTVTSAATTGQSDSVTIDFGTINVTVDPDFVTAGSTITCIKGVTSCTPKPAASSLTFRVPSTGTWTISGEISGTPYSKDAEVTSLSTPVLVTLQTTASVTVTLYSATEDTVSFTDASGVPRTEVFASGQSSKSVTLSIDPSGSNITFTSSVALDPENLDGSHYYSKTVSVTTAITDVYVMPDNALYWYGYINGMEDGIASNGWSAASGVSMVAIVKNKNNMYSNSPASTFVAEVTEDKVSSGRIAKAVFDCARAYSNFGTTLWGFSNKYFGDGTQALFTETLSTVSGKTLLSHSISSDCYLAVGSASNREGNVYALWLE